MATDSTRYGRNPHLFRDVYMGIIGYGIHDVGANKTLRDELKSIYEIRINPIHSNEQPEYLISPTGLQPNELSSTVLRRHYPPIPIVSPQWIRDSIRKGYKLPTPVRFNNGNSSSATTGGDSDVDGSESPDLDIAIRAPLRNVNGTRAGSATSLRSKRSAELELNTAENQKRRKSSNSASTSTSLASATAASALISVSPAVSVNQTSKLDQYLCHIKHHSTIDNDLVNKFPPQFEIAGDIQSGLLNLISCATCKQLPVKSYSMCINSHPQQCIYCIGCVRNQSTKCSFCNCKIDPNSTEDAVVALLVKSIIDSQLLVQCHYCNQAMHIGDNLQLLSQHYNVECAKVYTCECERVMSFAEYAAHIEQCNNQVISCPLAEIIRSSKLDIKSNSSWKCHWVDKRRDLRAHLEQQKCLLVLEVFKDIKVCYEVKIRNYESDRKQQQLSPDHYATSVPHVPNRYPQWSLNEITAQLEPKLSERLSIDIDIPDLLQLHTKIARKDQLQLFLLPISADFTLYHSMIKQSMCISVVNDKLQNGQLSTYGDYYNLMELIWSNAIQFNTNTDTHLIALIAAELRLSFRAYLLHHIESVAYRKNQQINSSHALTGSITPAVSTMEQPAADVRNDQCSSVPDTAPITAAAATADDDDDSVIKRSAFWTEREDTALIAGVHEHGSSRAAYDLILQDKRFKDDLQGRTIEGITYRYRKLNSMNRFSSVPVTEPRSDPTTTDAAAAADADADEPVAKRIWTEGEDAALFAGISVHGPGRAAYQLILQDNRFKHDLKTRTVHGLEARYYKLMYNRSNASVKTTAIEQKQPSRTQVATSSVHSLKKNTEQATMNTLLTSARSTTGALMLPGSSSELLNTSKMNTLTPTTQLLSPNPPSTTLTQIAVNQSTPLQTPIIINRTKATVPAVQRHKPATNPTYTSSNTFIPKKLNPVQNNLAPPTTITPDTTVGSISFNSAIEQSPSTNLSNSASSTVSMLSMVNNTAAVPLQQQPPLHSITMNASASINTVSSSTGIPLNSSSTNSTTCAAGISSKPIDSIMSIGSSINPNNPIAVPVSVSVPLTTTASAIGAISSNVITPTAKLITATGPINSDIPSKPSAVNTADSATIGPASVATDTDSMVGIPIIDARNSQIPTSARALVFNKSTLHTPNTQIHAAAVAAVAAATAANQASTAALRTKLSQGKPIPTPSASAPELTVVAVSELNNLKAPTLATNNLNSIPTINTKNRDTSPAILNTSTDVVSSEHDNIYPALIPVTLSSYEHGKFAAAIKRLENYPLVQVLTHKELNEDQFLATQLKYIITPDHFNGDIPANIKKYVDFNSNIKIVEEKHFIESIKTGNPPYTINAVTKHINPTVNPVSSKLVMASNILTNESFINPKRTLASPLSSMSSSLSTNDNAHISPCTPPELPVNLSPELIKSSITEYLIDSGAQTVSNKQVTDYLLKKFSMTDTVQLEPYKELIRSYELEQIAIKLCVAADTTSNSQSSSAWSEIENTKLMLAAAEFGPGVVAMRIIKDDPRFKPFFQTRSVEAMAHRIKTLKANFNLQKQSLSNTPPPQVPILRVLKLPTVTSFNKAVAEYENTAATTSNDKPSSENDVETESESDDIESLP